MFEGKSGFRVFKRKKDAELVAERNSKYGEKNLKVQKVRILNERIARKSGISVHADLSIAARSPKKNDIGWIVLSENESSDMELEDVLDFLPD